MSPRSLQYVLRSLAETASMASDADLLRRFLQQDEQAFAELVRRHGRLVWAVCRHLTRSDAEADDAFQATFLVLLKNAKKVREPGKLSAWLHGVAYKVCAKSRQSTKRRSSREQAAALREGNGSVVPDSAWDRALAAVHEEVAKLPDTLRVPFVLCCLEGVGVTEAAERLGWKLGTLSGRLTRAKDAVLLKLEARGMTLGVVATVGVVTVPGEVTAKATALAQVGFAVPGSILQLTQGVIGMNVKSFKVLAAAVLLTCGLGLSVGSGWVANAEAQPTAPLTPLTPKPTSEVKRLQDELEKAKRAEEEQKLVEGTVVRVRLKEVALSQGKPAFSSAKWEYDLVEMTATFDAVKFAALLQERENNHWEFLGSTVLGPNGGHFQWLFRRPVVVVRTTVSLVPRVEWIAPVATTKVEDAKAIEAEIKKLQEKLAAINNKPATLDKPSTKTTATISFAGFTDDESLAKLLVDLGEKKFGKGSIQVRYGNKVVTVIGSQEAIDWATGVVKSLAGK